MFWYGWMAGVLVMMVPLAFCWLGWKQEAKACSQALEGWGRALEGWRYWHDKCLKKEDTSL